MPRSREAISTIKGYYFQFDYYILQLLCLQSDDASVCIEGVEDVDIIMNEFTEAVQCKNPVGGPRQQFHHGGHALIPADPVHTSHSPCDITPQMVIIPQFPNDLKFFPPIVRKKNCRPFSDRQFSLSDRKNHSSLTRNGLTSSSRSSQSSL